MIFAVIPQLLEIFCRFSATFDPFYMLNVVHSDFNVDISLQMRKMQIWPKFAVIPQLLELFWRFRAAFASFHMPNAVHTDFDVEIIS
jgi:hypothetical protein